MHAAFAQFQHFFQHYGILAVFVILLLENLGLPFPGELALLYAGYHSRTQHAFGLVELVLAASAACIIGQSIGYGLGRFAGKWARRRFHLGGPRTARSEAFFRRHEPFAIFFARFIAGLRVLAGPVAGLYHMPWWRFLAYNALGAVVWSVAVSVAGAQLGAHWRRLLLLAGRLDVISLVAATLIIYLAWRRLRRAEAPTDQHHG